MRIPGLDMATLYMPTTLIWGGVITSASVHLNVTLTTSATSGSSDLGQHPGFSIKPLFYCSNTHNITPLSHGLYIISTSTMGLADALLDIAANVTSSPGAASTAVDGAPTLAIIEQDMSINGVVQLAASQNSSVGLGVPLIITSSLYPLQLGDPVPPCVTLDLSGCVGCVSLTGPARVYLTNLHLTGLQRPGISNGVRGGDGSQLSLPLWALQANRSASVPPIILYNVTLTLPQVPPTTTLLHPATPCTLIYRQPTPCYTLHPQVPSTYTLLHPVPSGTINLHPATPCTLRYHQPTPFYTLYPQVPSTYTLLHPVPSGTIKLHLTPSTICLYNSSLRPTPCIMHPTPHTLHHAPCTLQPSPYNCILHPAFHSLPCTTHSAPTTMHPVPCTLHPAPYTLHPTPYNLKPCTLYPTPYTLQSVPYTLFFTLYPAPTTHHHVPCTLYPAPYPPLSPAISG